jgi:pyruvate dehydrogenase E1 component alpha subunit
MPGTAVDGNEVLRVREAALEAVELARKGQGPSLIECKTYRVRGHFEGDPQRYRSEEEVQRWQHQKDPLSKFADFLADQNMLNPALDQQIWDEVAAKLIKAVAYAEESPFPEPAEALEDLFAN